MTLGWIPTAVILAAAATVAVWANVMDRRPEPIGHPRRLPYTLIQILCVVIAIFMAAHMVTLVAGTTERPPLLR